MDPPIQTEYFLSGGAMILIFMVGGARDEISFCIRSDAGEHRRPAGENRVRVKILSDVDVALHDAVVRRLVNASRLHADESGLKQGLGAPESFVSDGNNLSVRKPM